MWTGGYNPFAGFRVGSIFPTRTSGLPIGACGSSKYKNCWPSKAADSVVLQQMLQAILCQKCSNASPPPSIFWRKKKLVSIWTRISAARLLRFQLLKHLSPGTIHGWVGCGTTWLYLTGFPSMLLSRAPTMLHCCFFTLVNMLVYGKSTCALLGRNLR